MVFACLAVIAPTAGRAGDELEEEGENIFLGTMLQEFCVDTFPRFAKAASVIDSAPYFKRRAGQLVWDHQKLAVTMALFRVGKRPACVMQITARRWVEGTWADFAVPAFGKTWDSDQTIIDLGKGHPGDYDDQHMVVRFPTHQLFRFDADQREDGRWTYKIYLIAAN